VGERVGRERTSESTRRGRPKCIKMERAGPGAGTGYWEGPRGVLRVEGDRLLI